MSRARRWAATALVVTGLPAVLLALAAVFWDGPVTAAAVAGGIFAFTLLSGIAAVWDCTRHVSVIPYFQRNVGDIDTFLAGSAVARCLPSLDALAAELGVTPLSEFGFGDDMRGETVVWHAPEEGLRTVQALLQSLDTAPDRIRDPSAVREDLIRLVHALERARDQRIRFSLLLRHGNATSALEWERRIGTAF